MTNRIRFLLNDQPVTLDSADPTGTLLDYLRLAKRLTGSKEGCAEGDCGACTVLVGRLVKGVLRYEAVNACIRFIGSLNASHVVTVEHLAAKDGTLHPVQQAMVDCHGSQCGFCTPGFVMSLYGLWLESEAPSRAEIERALQGNLCRCTGYEPIVKAAEQMGQTKPSALFDPLAREREQIIATLEAMTSTDTIALQGDDGRSLIVPNSVEALANVLAAHPKATIVAGATDVGLWVTKQMRTLSPVVFINHLEALQAITIDDTGITLGAGVNYSAAFDCLRAEIPAFGRLIERIGGQQVRNMGTIGGNIANGSPIGDTPPALIALGATVTLRSASGTRTLLLEDFFIEYGRQDRQSGEFVERIFLPRPKAESDFAIYKISKRRDEDISALCGAFYLEKDAQARVTTLRIAFGGMAGTPKRARAVEVALMGKVWNQESIDAARAAFDADYQPLSDWRASADYRQLTAKNLLTRFFLETSGERQELERFAMESV
ncbi:xanthine dehydrogenase small subunit [Agrobacterium vitis]|uniref:Xanthine dehydrogenase small subunit n=1 Tax=Agrobacterium vitis TaxID=373 RepID=A0ABD6G569_AGRVI|nr:xanthine dehydrogenase small subunit [Agrobacterium vitis]MUO80165.1 xanthine dehydrogenase small subunit [Agrobacterium vitis]MUO97322.1 xanthine dehydrogenase small subunit [Agrobacterium vitis]MUP03717.1 xanthine dehydrogenase small subunit [Agrobacterium vitis]MUZ82601.1 xanthine dehydrogenase small subunit [Agrobacterium vitis]MVA09942.1 xanthine dehydrogenase small subunit [Agrobacterium vitis]